MRIDLSLIRQILLSVEEEKLNSRTLNEEKFILQYRFKNLSYYTTNQTEKGIFIYHLKYLSAKELIECELMEIMGGQYMPKRGVIDLTAAGHDLLDQIRSEKVFNRIVEKLKDLGGELSLDLIKAAASKIIVGLLE